MRGKMRRLLRIAPAAVVLVLAGVSGCSPFFGSLYPFSMGIYTPIPVPPWVSTRIEDRFQNKNDYRTPILPPIRPGFPEPLCEDPQYDAVVLRAFAAVKGGVPSVLEGIRVL